MDFLSYLIIGVLLVLLVLNYVKKNKSGTDESKENELAKEDGNKITYSKKPLMTDIEKKFYEAFKSCMNDKYFVLPQVNLATVISKQGEFKYQNELFRNIDFCVFDSEYNPIVLIEINDESHNEYRRKQRDAKVKEICKSADIPLVVFYTKYGVNQEYISKRLGEYLTQRLDKEETTATNQA